MSQERQAQNIPMVDQVGNIDQVPWHRAARPIVKIQLQPQAGKSEIGSDQRIRKMQRAYAV